MNYQQKLKYYRNLYSFHEYQQIMKLIYNIDTYVNNILEMGLSDDMENALISAFIDQNEVVIQEAMNRLTLFGQNVEDDCNDKPKEGTDDDKCRCCDHWIECVYIEPGKFYVDGVGIIDSNGKSVEEDDVPYTDDDKVDLRDDFADDEEDEQDEEEGDDFADDEKESFVDDEEEDFVDEDDKEENDGDDEKDEDDDISPILAEIVKAFEILKKLGWWK